jgi:hypothetical protein
MGSSLQDCNYSTDGTNTKRNRANNGKKTVSKADNNNPGEFIIFFNFSTDVINKILAVTSFSVNRFFKITKSSLAQRNHISTVRSRQHFVYNDDRHAYCCPTEYEIHAHAWERFENSLYKKLRWTTVPYPWYCFVFLQEQVQELSFFHLHEKGDGEQ